MLPLRLYQRVGIYSSVSHSKKIAEGILLRGNGIKRVRLLEIWVDGCNPEWVDSKLVKPLVKETQ